MMLYEVKTGKGKKCFDELCNEMTQHNQPLHENPLINYKFLGHYVSVQGTVENPEAFQVYDLYICEGSKFFNREKYFVARFGNELKDYVHEYENVMISSEALMGKEKMKTYALGEAYRRYKHRTPCMGVYK